VSATVRADTGLEEMIAAGFRFIGEISIEAKEAGSFTLAHRDDAGRKDLLSYAEPEDAAEIARFDDAGKYRPLKTAPNLRHGWQMTLTDGAGLRRALDLFYPGRLGVFLAWRKQALAATPLRETLGRQTGMYRAAAKIDEHEADALVGGFCRSDRGCLRTILWKRNERGAPASTLLPPEKFDPQHDQSGKGARVIPLLCQEACSLLVSEARKIVKLHGAPA
jgi:sirohydrochlorin cobaltochelatase